MTPIETRVDWNGIKKCLGILHQESPDFLSRSLLIGGAASWFYRIQLQRAADSDFGDPPESAASREGWLSKDVDFTGIFRADAFEMLPKLVEKDSVGNRILKVGGVRIGFAQVGVTFDPDESFRRARIGQFQEGDRRIEFLVMDPVTLYREKQALALKRNQQNDRLHLDVLKEYVAWELVDTCRRLFAPGNVGMNEKRRWISFLLDVKDRALEILQDQRVIRRTQHFLSGDSADAKLMRDLFS